jgi:gluconolactonase
VITVVDTVAGRIRRFTELDAAFRRVVGSVPMLARVADVDAHEGPTYFADEDAVYVTTVAYRESPARIKRIRLDESRFPAHGVHVDVLPADVAAPNGMTRDVHGALLVCDHGSLTRPARVCRVDRRTGTTTTVIDAIAGLELNSPNDVTVTPDGSIWFSDPSYGHLQGFRPPPTLRDAVYRVDDAGEITVAAADFDKPNGVAFSPDFATLYVTDSGANQEPGSFHPDRPHELVAFDVVGDGRLTNRRVMDRTPRGFPDGVTTDIDGRVYVCCADGVRVLTPDGRLLGSIDIPGAVNVTFGGHDGNYLFITADTALWVAALDTKGV